MEPIDESTLRYELKLTCEAHWLAQARAWLRLHPAGFRTAHPSRTVNSLYLDTQELSLLHANLNSLGQREKVRLRWYGDHAQNPILELKVKENLLGAKKQTPLTLTLDFTQRWAEILAMVAAAAPPSWQLILQTHNRPVLINRYQREYYVTFDGQIRATLDYNQQAYNQRYSELPNLQSPLPLADLLVIELKANASETERLESMVANFPIPRTRNSKYVNGVLAGL